MSFSKLNDMLRVAVRKGGCDDEGAVRARTLEVSEAVFSFRHVTVPIVEHMIYLLINIFTIAPL